MGTKSRGGAAGAVRRQAVAGTRSWVGSAAGATCRSSRGRGRATIAVEGAIETWESTADPLSSWAGCVEETTADNLSDGGGTTTSRG